METLVWILQVVPHAIFITGLIVAGHWAIKKIIISWNLKWGDRYWYIDYWGNVNYRNYADAIIDRLNIDNGNVYYTEEECKKAHERKLAEVRLRKTSTFEPDFENGKGGWIVEYDYAKHRLAAWRYPFENSGEPVRYETEEDAKKSIEENREDWLKYFGIEEWK